MELAHRTTRDRRGNFLLLPVLLATARSLLDGGADPNAAGAIDGRPSTPLVAAAREGTLALVTLLLTRGAGVGSPAGDGTTPLHAAAGAGHEEAVDTLLRAGADAAAVDARGATPADAAEAGEHAHLAAVLRARVAAAAGTEAGGGPRRRRRAPPPAQ